MKQQNSLLIKKEIANLLFFWFFGVIFFFFYRIVFLFLYKNEINNNTSIENFIDFFFIGFRFDMTVVSYFMVIPLLVLLIAIPFKAAKYIKPARILFEYLFVIICTLLCLVTYNYYKEYNDQFNEFLFLGLYDDKTAVLKTIIKHHHPIINTISIISVLYFSYKIFNYFENKKTIYNHLKNRNLTAILVICLILFSGSIRGSFADNPVRRFYAFVTPDQFLNKITINPLRSLRNAITDFKKLNSTANSSNPFGVFNNNISLPPSNKTLGNTIETPNHIFLVIMESYDAWPLQEKFEELGVSTELKQIERKGIRFTNFLPASNSTMDSFISVATGIPFCGVNIGKQGSLRHFDSSIFTQFKKLGYTTNFFYGGWLGWQHINNFTKKQGADNVYGAVNSKGDKGIWGLYDDNDLFDLVLEKANKNEKTLNIILTMSYHSPYEVDVYDKGFPYKKITDLPEKYQKIYDTKKMPLRVLGHLWHADKAIGKFVKEAEKKMPNSLFGFTGDHFGRRFINSSPNLYENSAVSFILYGNNLKEKGVQNHTPGSHIDIAPTLFDLIAPKGFTYYGFGNTLFDNSKKLGVAIYKVIDSSHVYVYKNEGSMESMNLKTLEQKLDNKTIYKKEHDSIMGMSWKYIRQNNWQKGAK